MPTPKKGARLGGSPAHQRLIVANLATALFEHGRITTTGPRKGDNAPMAVIELVTESYTPSAPKASRQTGQAAPAATVEKPAEDAPAEVEATGASGETEVLDTQAAAVETAEAESET